jgi:hypothetical protein
MQPNVISGTTASLRPTGIARYFSAVFLAVWLAGWAVGEIVASGVLIGIFSSILGARPFWFPPRDADFLKSGGVAFVVLFLLVWLTFWTVGGLTAATQLLRSLAGEDTIALDVDGFELTRRAGPLRRRYRFARTAVRRIRLRSRDRAVVADTEKGTRVLTQFGEAPEREAIALWLKQHLGQSDAAISAAGGMVPATWDVTSDDVTTYVRKVKPGARASRAIIAWLLTGVAGWAWFASFGNERPMGSVFALAFVVLLAFGASATTWGRREWIARPGELTFRRAFATWTAEQTFRSARLEVTHERDSDNDSRYELVVADGQQRRVIHWELHDSGEVDDLGRWLGSRTGFPFTPAA